MKQLLWRLFVDILLLIVIALILVFNVSFFISGPMILNEKRDREILLRMEEQNKKTGCQAVARFSDDRVYYIASCNSRLVFYDASGGVLAERSLATYDEKKYAGVLKSEGKVDVSLGYYHGEPVYVYRNDVVEVIVHYDDGRILRYFQKGM